MFLLLLTLQKKTIYNIQMHTTPPPSSQPPPPSSQPSQSNDTHN